MNRLDYLCYNTKQDMSVTSYTCNCPSRLAKSVIVPGVVSLEVVMQSHQRRLTWYIAAGIDVCCMIYDVHIMK